MFEGLRKALRLGGPKTDADLGSGSLIANVNPFASAAKDHVPFKSPPRPSACRDFGVADFPVEINSFGPFGHALCSHLNFANPEPLREYVASTRLPGAQAIAIDLRDCSSSMQTYSAGVVRGESVMTHKLQDFPAAHTTLYQIGFNSTLLLLNKAQPVDIKSRFCFSADDLSMSRDGLGGKLAGGSQISDALTAGVGIGLAYRYKGFTNPISVNVLTDGWNRNAFLKSSHSDPSKIDMPVHSDWEKFSEERARQSIEQGRAAGITFCMNGFVDSPAALERLTRFASKIGLRESEVHITMIDQADPHATVVKAMMEHGHSMSGIRQLPGNP